MTSLNRGIFDKKRVVLPVFWQFMHRLSITVGSSSA